VFDGVGDGLRQVNGEAKIAGRTRGREGGARRGITTTSRYFFLCVTRALGREVRLTY